MWPLARAGVGVGLVLALVARTGGARVYADRRLARRPAVLRIPRAMARRLGGGRVAVALTVRSQPAAPSRATVSLRLRR